MTNRIFYLESTHSPNVFWVDLSALRFDEGVQVLCLDPRDPSLVGGVSGRLSPRQWVYGAVSAPPTTHT